MSPSKPVPTPNERRGFRRAVLRWFDRCGRHDLPWQHNPTPYRVWVSEIMLQQTQVATVIPYFKRFMTRFPDVTALAGAPEDDVLHLWTGLGYYNRARHLHRTAQRVVAEHGGAFPDNVDALTALPGIGRSTAGAIVAIAFQRRASILDGNVKRVLARYHAVAGWPGDTVTARRLWTYAENYTPRHRVADYTQAMMDLGATVCTRTRPDCPACPLRRGCRARADGDPARFPGKKPQRATPEKATEVLVIRAGRHVLLEKRPDNGVWARLWSLPEHPLNADSERRRRVKALTGRVPVSQTPGEPVRHAFSHYRLTLHPVHLTLRGRPPAVTRPDLLWYNMDAPPRVGLAAPVQRLLAALA